MPRKYKAPLDTSLAKFFANTLAQTLMRMSYNETAHHLAPDAPQVFIYEKGEEKFSLTLTSMPDRKTLVEIVRERPGGQKALEEGCQDTVLGVVKALYSPLVRKKDLEKVNKTIRAALNEPKRK